MILFATLTTLPLSKTCLRGHGLKGRYKPCSAVFRGELAEKVDPKLSVLGVDGLVHDMYFHADSGEICFSSRSQWED